MRYIVIILFFFVSCTATNVKQQGQEYNIVIEYSAGHKTETNILALLSRMTDLQRFQFRETKLFSSKIEATCLTIKEEKMEALYEALENTHGVIEIVFNK